MEQRTTISNRLTDLFRRKPTGLLNIYCTAGFPALNDTINVIKALEEAGADMIEVGMPFSDPLADGPTIQQSNDVALKNGMSIKVLFDQLKDLRKHVSVPVLLMGYLNPVMQYGVEEFCRKASEIGVDGIILPDLPFDEYNEQYKPIFEEYNLSNVFLVTPNTSPARMRLIDDTTEGFIYVVSTDSTTGSAKSITQGQEEYFNRVKNAGLRNPVMIGFNINNAESFQYALKYANGAIIGSAFIKAIKESKDLKADIKKFVSSIKN